MTKEDRDKELKDIAARRIQLGQLAGQLGSFIGGGGKVSEAIQNAIKAYEKQIEDCKNSNNHENSVDCQNAENCQSIKKQMEKLKSLKETNKNSQNNPNDLLTNLCNGLENFLGFNSDSKGYNGSGIVYSDLDRLCDAVMGFLYQVLKDVSEKQPYSVGKREINEALEMLKECLSTGRKGFSVIAQVTEKVRGYNERVKESNDEVKNVIDEMTNNINKYNKNALKSLLTEEHFNDTDAVDEARTQVDSHLKNCATETKAYIDGMIPVINNIQNLNYESKVKVENANTTVEHEYDRLQDLAWKGKRDLAHMEKKTSDVLEILKMIVNEQITKTVRDLVTQMKAFVNDIKLKLEEISKLSQEAVNKLVDWIDAAINIIDKAKGRIDNEILPRVQEKHSRNARGKTKITQEVEVLQNKGDALLKAYATSYNALDGLKTGISDSVRNIEKVYQDKLLAVKKGVIVDVNDALHQNAENSLDKLDEHLSTDLEGLRGKINIQLGQFVKHLGEALNEGMSKTGYSYGKERYTKFKTTLGRDSPLYNAFDKADTHNANFAAAMDSVLLYLRQAKDAKPTVLGAPTGEQLFTELGEALKTCIENQLQQIIKGSRGSMKFDRSFMHNYHEQTKKEEGSTVGKFRGLIKMVKNKVKNDGFTGDESFVEFKPDEMQGYQHKNIMKADGDGAKPKLTQQIDRVTNALQEFVIQRCVNLPLNKQANVEDKQRELTSLVESVTTELQGIAWLVDSESIQLKPRGIEGDTGDSIKQRLDGLRTKITSDSSNELAGIRNALVDLLGVDVAQALKSARAFVETEADNNGERTITALEYYITHQISSATATLTTAARRNYVTSVKKLLTAFADKVEKELAPLPGEIDRDLTIGFKGLMKRFEGEFNTRDNIGENIQLLKDVNNVRDLSYSFKVFNGPLHIGKNKYDREVPSKLDNLEAAIEGLKPDGFALPNSPVLDGIVKGLRKFIGELRKVYISRYDSQICGERIKNYKQASSLTGVVEQYDVTAEGGNCAKVCLTTFTILFNSLTEVRKVCDGEGKFKKIYLSTEQTKNPVGDYLALCGYTVSNRDEQNGELQRNDNMKGNDILHNLCRTSSSVFNSKKEEDFSGQLKDIFDYLHHYYRVCHLPTTTSNKYPSSVFHMLRWLCGFSYNGVYNEVSVNDFSDLFEKQNDAEPTKGDDLPVLTVTDGGGNSVIPVVGESADSLIAYPANVTASNLRTTLTEVCHIAHDVLTSILGHGHADGIYAVDFNTNPDGFSYPTAPGACFDMLCDVLKRLYQQLYFLYGQCSNEEPSVSWRDCWYGNRVGGSDWKCNAMQCPNQKGNQIHNQKRNQKCDQTAECGLKSPLQSFLEDGLPGFLPHSFTKPGCKLECSYSNHRGIPCRTPMGFGDISVAASHRQTGAYLKKVLEDFCGSESAPLTKLCAQLNCLLQKPPQTLGEIFAFYYGYLEEWAYNFYGRPQKDKPYTRDAFREAVNDAYFGKQYAHLDPTALVSSSKHTDAHTKGNLCTISNCESGSVAPCGLYVKSTTQEISKYYSSEHKANHLSWIVYITETFYDLLKKLYDDCCKKCGSGGSKCHVKSCDEQCEIKYSDDKTKKISLENKCHKLECKSIVTCRDTHPTLYKYGFTFGHSWGLNGSGNNEGAKRTCKDFCEALKKMISKESVLIELRKQIDDFLWAIREYFSYTILALWLLSLLYLLHIMVIRLDPLHIKSHLHSPSSHRIAAQSLLAAARVGKLAKITYLQP